jgi:hypothetical protein
VVFFNLKEGEVAGCGVTTSGFFFVVWIIRNEKKKFAIGKNKNWRFWYVELLFFVIAYGG